MGTKGHQERLKKALDMLEGEMRETVWKYNTPLSSQLDAGPVWSSF